MENQENHNDEHVIVLNLPKWTVEKHPNFSQEQVMRVCDLVKDEINEMFIDQFKHIIDATALHLGYIKPEDIERQNQIEEEQQQ